MDGWGWQDPIGFPAIRTLGVDPFLSCFEGSRLNFVPLLAEAMAGFQLARLRPEALDPARFWRRISPGSGAAGQHVAIRDEAGDRPGPRGDVAVGGAGDGGRQIQFQPRCRSDEYPGKPRRCVSAHGSCLSEVLTHELRMGNLLWFLSRRHPPRSL